MSARSAFISALSLFLALIGIVAAVGGYGVHTFFAPGALPDNKLVLIERGMGVSGIAAKLESENVISSALMFKIAARLTEGEGTLKAGEYEFTAHIPMAGALSLMRAGDVFDRKFTIPEGLTSHQIFRIIAAVPDLEGDMPPLPADGTLMPETYTFMKGDTRAQKISEMQSAMTKTLDELWNARAPGLPLNTKEDALTLASIVEKETGVAAERERIAGVFINRLRQGIALQTDPTVIYAITKGDMKDDGQGPLGRRLLTKDLDIDSPYNTYKYPGLPPGPICHPGRAAIAATLNPETHDYIYFVADGTGGHVFAKTLDEHNRNVAKWRQIRKSQ